jgi:hypothetical protein
MPKKKKVNEFLIRNRHGSWIAIIPLKGFTLEIEDSVAGISEEFSIKETKRLANVLRTELKLPSQCEVQLYDAISSFLDNWYADGPNSRQINRFQAAMGKFEKLYGERRYGKWKDARD